MDMMRSSGEESLCGGMDRGVSKLGSSASSRERLLNWRGLARMGAVRNCDCPVNAMSAAVFHYPSHETILLSCCGRPSPPAHFRPRFFDPE